MSKDKTLGDVLLGIEAGKSLQTSEVLARENELGILKVSAVSWSAFRPEEAKAILNHEPDERHRVTAGDLLLSRANTRELVGAVALVEKDYPQRILSDKTLRLVVDPTKADKLFLMYALRTPAARAHIEEFASGSSDSMRNISQSVITSIPIPLPELGEQQWIARVLRERLAVVEEARRAAQAQVSELESLKASAIADTLSRVSGRCRIGDLAKLQSGYAFKSADFQKAGVRLLRNANILPEKVYWDDVVFLSEEGRARHASYELQAGDILISLDRPIISTGIKVARVASTDIPALLVQRVGRFVLNMSRVVPDYLYAFLQSNQFIEAISGHDQSLGVPHISPSQVEDVLMPFASLEEQTQIAKRLTSIMAETALGFKAAQAQLDEIRQLPARLLAQAFASQADADDLVGH